MTNKLLCNGEFALFEKSNDCRPYFVAEYNSHMGAWQQVTKSFFYKGRALREYKKLIA